MIRAGIVGLGWWGQTLVNSVQGKTDALRFAAAHVRNPARAEAFMKEKDLSYFDSLDAMLADPSIDAVVLATPHSEHAAQVTKVANAGKHVFVEKPFTLDLPSAEGALAAVAKAGVTLGVGFQRRFPPSIGEIRTRIRDGRLGTIAHCEGHATAPAGLSMSADSWRANAAEAPAGAMTALGIHVLDGLIDLCGEIDEVTCLNVRRAAPVDDTTNVLISFKNGATGSLLCCLATAPSYRMAVYGTKGYAEASRPLLDLLRIVPVPSGPPGTPPAAPEVVETPGFDPIHAELVAFATAAGGGAPYPIPPSEVRHGVAAFEAIVKSSATRQTVKVA